MASQENEDGQKSNQDKVRQLEWLLDKNIQKTAETEDPYKPYYGDVTELNTCRLIMDSVGKETLKDISEDAIDLLDTSVAIYEANGDYAFGMFSSGWCRLMDAASRELCQTDDNRKALDGGRWLCHENCWNDSAKPAIESGQSTDIKCVGGINLYAEPIYAGGRIVGVINIGYGNPPKEVEQLKELAETFNINFKRLNERANSYYPRPKFLVSLAKKRLRSAAKLIGEIVEKAQIEKMLKAQEERLQLVIKGSNDAPWDWDLISNELYYSPQWWLQLGYTPNELPVNAALWERLMHPEDSDHVDSVFRGALKNGIESYKVEFRLLHKEGHYVPVLSRGFITRDETGNPIRVTGSNMDLSERKKAEDALKQSEKKFRNLFQHHAAIKWIIDPDTGNIVDANEAAEAFYGRSVEQLKRMRIQDINTLSPEQIKAEMEKAKASKNTQFEFKHRLADGSIRDVEVFSSGVQIGDKNLIHSILHDITNRKQAEQAVLESEAKLKTILDSLPDMVLEVDSELKIHWANNTALDLNPNAVGQTCYKAFSGNESACEGCPCHKAFETGEMEMGLIYQPETKTSGESYWENIGVPLKDSDGNVIRCLEVLRNVTERELNQKREKELQILLMQNQKMESIATLTGGIAHDYNNLMSIIMGNQSMAMEEAPPGSDLADFLNEANMASCKVRDLTHELMSLSRGGAPVKEVGSLGELLNDASDIIPADSGISLVKSISQDLKLVSYDPYKMVAVFRNVLTNAVEAMPNGGILKIKAENLRIEDEVHDSDLPLTSGDYVHISIQDQGKGIPKENLNKVFDPYFSTKDMGVQKGMGLGLATAYAIVKKHGGHFAINSSPDVGTTVNIYLRAEGQPEEIGSKIISIDSALPVERVLVMDDEEMLRNLSRQMLERMGYAVETVKDGLEAIEAYKKRKDMGEPFGAVILDLTIKGGMGGEQTIRELLKIDPDVKAIVFSGYFNDPVMADFQGYGFKGAMAKPYDKKNLKEAMETLFS